MPKEESEHKPKAKTEEDGIEDGSASEDASFAMAKNVNGKCKHSRCKFREEMLEELKDEILEELDNYLLLDEAESYITDIVVPKLAEFKEEAEKEAAKKYDQLQENMEDINQKTMTKLEFDIQHLSIKVDNDAREAATRFKTQDDIIDLVSCEISKDSKKKSDILIDLDYIKKETAALQK